MSDFFHFWFDCFFGGWSIAYGIINFIGTAAFLVSGFLVCRKRHEHRQKWEEFTVKWAFRIFCLAFAISTICIAPFLQYQNADTARMTAQQALADKSPKLDAFIDQWMIFVRQGETNTTIIPQIHINNFGGSGSLAENFKLKFVLATNDSVEAKPIDIPDYYQWQSMKDDQITVFRLSRQELISEKAAAAIEPGFGPRGWLAFTLPRLLSQNQLTNFHFIISFLDSSGNQTFVTNGFWKGQALTNNETFDIPRTLAGSVNLVYTNYQLQSDVANGWRPPELPLDCSNVVIYFGTSPMVYPLWYAKASPESSGTEFDVSDLPDSVFNDFATNPAFPPRQKYVSVRQHSEYTIGGKSLSYPIQPIVISNRLYVEVEIPFSNEKHKLVMSDAFDTNLPIPLLWDRNFSTNYEANRGVYLYEVVNELKNPVLQVVYAAPNIVLVNGIFQVDSNSILAAFGQPPALLTFAINSSTQAVVSSLLAENFHETLTIQSNETIASFGRRLTNELFRPIFKYQKPAFKYPSDRYLGVFEDWQDETNKSDTNTLDRLR